MPLLQYYTSPTAQRSAVALFVVLDSEGGRLSFRCYPYWQADTSMMLDATAFTDSRVAVGSHVMSNSVSMWTGGSGVAAEQKSPAFTHIMYTM